MIQIAAETRALATFESTPGSSARTARRACLSSSPRRALGPWPRRTPRPSARRACGGRQVRRGARPGRSPAAGAAARCGGRDRRGPLAAPVLPPARHARPARRRRMSARPHPGTRARVRRRVSSIQVAPSATRITTTSSREKSATSADSSRNRTTIAEATYAHTRFSKRGCEPAARGQRPAARAGEPRGDEEEDPDEDHQPERAAHELGEDVPGVVRRLAVVARARRASRRRSSA